MSDIPESSLFEIDWKSLEAALSEALREASGVVHVRLEQDAAEATFIRTLTESWLRKYWAGDKIVVIRIEPTDNSTRDQDAIAAQIVRKCGLSVPSNETGPPMVEMFKGLIADEIDISNNEISTVLNYYAGWRGVDALDLVRAGLKDFLADRRLVLVFENVDGFDDRVRARLGRELWQGCLARFEHSGVLLVCLYGRNSRLDVVDDTGFPPPARVIVDLLAQIPAGDVADSIEDVALIAMREQWFPSWPEAVAFAKGRVVGVESMRFLHTSLRFFEGSDVARNDRATQQ